MRLIIFCGLVLGACLLSSNLLPAESNAVPSTDDDTYVPPAGGPPPVAPPVKKGSPLDHLTNDPKMESLPIGYKEGKTVGAPFYIAHRGIDDMDGQGWGWVKKGGEDWDSAKWIALQETPGVAVAPFRKLLKRDGDANWEFKFWGSFAPYKAYDPHLDELLPVFVLEGYEVIGPKGPLGKKIGPPDRVRHKPSGASSRSERPILTDPNVD